MKAIWRTNPKGDTLWPDWVKLRSAGVTRIYIPLYYYDPAYGKFFLNTDELTQNYREGVNSQGFQYGLYTCWNWQSAYSDPKVMAGDMADAMETVGNVAAAMYNDETHSSSRILALLKAHRTKEPHGPLSWALEGMQGGWFTSPLVNWINSDTNCVCVPESFEGDMTPINVGQVRTNLINAGINGPRAKVFLDASKPRIATWDGCLLSEETLR